MKMSEQIEQLQQQIVVLKSRILDTQDTVVQAQQQSQNLANEFTKIVGILGLGTNEKGQIAIEDVITEIEKLKLFQTEALKPSVDDELLVEH